MLGGAYKLRLEIGGSWYTCGTAGEELTIKNLVGTFTCPDPTAECFEGATPELPAFEAYIAADSAKSQNRLAGVVAQLAGEAAAQVVQRAAGTPYDGALAAAQAAKVSGGKWVDISTGSAPQGV